MKTEQFLAQILCTLFEWGLCCVGKSDQWSKRRVEVF